MTAREVKIEMLNKALQIMTGYQSDIVYDFESIDEMKDVKVKKDNPNFLNSVVDKIKSIFN